MKEYRLTAQEVDSFLLGVPPVKSGGRYAVQVVATENSDLKGVYMSLFQDVIAERQLPDDEPIGDIIAEMKKDNPDEELAEWYGDLDTDIRDRVCYILATVAGMDYQEASRRLYNE